MKTITLKKQLLLVVLIFFCGVTPTFADNDTSMTLNVEAGTLSSLIPASKMYEITELKLSGELNVEDLKLIRRMGACRKSTKEEWYDGHLQHLDISNAEFVGDGMFVYYDNYYRTVNFTDRKYLFAGMQSLQTIELPNTMKEIDGSLFYDCSNLVSLTLPSELTTINASLGSLASSPNLMSIKIDKNNPYYNSDGAILFNKDKSKIVLAKKTLDAYSIPSSVTQIQSWAFAGCKSLIYLTLPSGLTQIGDGTFSGCRSLKSLTLPSGVTQIGDQAFQDCSSLYSLKLPSSVTQIGAFAFKDCSSLYSLTLPSGVTQIGQSVFHGCSSLYSLTLPSSLTQIGPLAFYRCSSLRSLTLPSSVTQIGMLAFSGCSSLRSLTLPSGVTQIGDRTFEGCSSLYSLTLPSGVTQIGNYAFQDCSSLSSLTLPSSVTQIGEHAFAFCSSLQSIGLPSSLTQIGASAFQDCYGLKSLELPSNLTKIGENAFCLCNNLATLTLPSSLREINAGIFYLCEKIETIYSYMSDPLPLKFEKSVMDNAILYVPKGSYQNYVLADYWKEFKNIKEFDPETAGINNTQSADNTKELSRYAVNGQRLAAPTKGLNIVRYSNGTVKKVMEK